MKSLRTLGVLAFAAALGAPSRAGDDAPAPPDKPALARQLLATAQAALRRKEPRQAEAALRKAVRNDPTLPEAHYLLGRLAQSAGRTREAAARYRAYLKLTAAATQPSADDVRQRPDAEGRLRRVQAYAAKWLSLRSDWAKRFRRLAAGRGGRPSCVRALEIAGALAPKDKQAAAELAAARKAIADLLPPPPAKPDPDAAALLAEQAAEHRKDGRTNKAAELLRRAAALARDLPTLVALAEVELAAQRPTAAAVAAAEAERLLARAGKDQRKQFAARIAGVLTRADPHRARVDALLDSFASAGEDLAGSARDDNDLDVAKEIAALLAKLLPPEASGSSGDDRPGGQPDLSSRHVRVAFPPGARWKRWQQGVEFWVVKSAAHPGGAQAWVTLGRFVCGRKLRATWRIEQFAPPPRSGGAVAVGFLPDADLRVWARKSRRAVEFTHGGRDTVARRAEREDAEDMYNAGGRYSVTFEKNGPVVTVRVGRRELASLRLTSKRQQELAARPLTLWLAVDGLHKQPLAVRATLTAFSCSPDCVRPVAGAPGEGRPGR